MKHDGEAPNVLRFYTELQQITSVAACSALFKEAVARFGMVAFACGELDLADRDRNVIFVAEWPKACLIDSERSSSKLLHPSNRSTGARRRS